MPLKLKIGVVTNKRQGTAKRAPTSLIAELARVYGCSMATVKRIAKDFRQQIEQPGGDRAAPPLQGQLRPPKKSAGYGEAKIDGDPEARVGDNWEDGGDVGVPIVRSRHLGTRLAGAVPPTQRRASPERRKRLSARKLRHRRGAKPWRVAVVGRGEQRSLAQAKAMLRGAARG